MVAQGFNIDGNQLSRAKSLPWTIKINHIHSLCNSQHLTQPPLALAVPLARFPSRVGGGSSDRDFEMRHEWPDIRIICSFFLLEK
jgi:hypothetical protein